MKKLQNDCFANKPFLNTKQLRREYHDGHLKYRQQIEKISSLNRLNRSVDRNNNDSFLPPISKNIDVRMRNSHFEDFDKGIFENFKIL